MDQTTGSFGKTALLVVERIAQALIGLVLGALLLDRCLYRAVGVVCQIPDSCTRLSRNHRGGPP